MAKRRIRLEGLRWAAALAVGASLWAGAAFAAPLSADPSAVPGGAERSLGWMMGERAPAPAASAVQTARPQREGAGASAAMGASAPASADEPRDALRARRYGPDRDEPAAASSVSAGAAQESWEALTPEAAPFAAIERERAAQEKEKKDRKERAIGAAAGGSPEASASKAQAPAQASGALAAAPEGTAAAKALLGAQLRSAGDLRDESLGAREPFIRQAWGRLLGRETAPQAPLATGVKAIAKAPEWPAYGGRWPVGLVRFEGMVDGHPGWAWARVIEPLRGPLEPGEAIAVEVARDFPAADAQEGREALALIGPTEGNGAPGATRVARLSYAAQANAFNALRIQRWAAEGEAREAGAQWSLALAGLLGIAAMACAGGRNRPLTRTRARWGFAFALGGFWSAIAYLVDRDPALPGSSDVWLLLPTMAFCLIGAVYFIAAWPARDGR
jgi:hypothetical protein